MNKLVSFSISYIIKSTTWYVNAAGYKEWKLLINFILFWSNKSDSLFKIVTRWNYEKKTNYELECRGTIHLVANWILFCGKQCLPSAGILSGSLFPWVMWILWKARNRFVFEGFSTTPEDTLSTAIVLAREWTEGHNLETQKKRKHPQAEVISPPN